MLIKRKSIEAESNFRSGPKAAAIPKPRKIKFAPVTLSELDGVRYLHFGTEWVQGAMRLRKPDWLELDTPLGAAYQNLIHDIAQTWSSPSAEACPAPLTHPGWKGIPDEAAA